MEQELRIQYRELLQFYEIVVCGLKGALKAVVFDGEILKVAKKLAIVRHELKEKAEGINKKIIELNRKKDEAITDARLIVRQLKAVVVSISAVLNGGISGSLQRAVDIFRQESEKMLPEIKNVIKRLNFDTEALQITTDLEGLLDCVEDEKQQVSLKEQVALVREKFKACGASFLVVSGRLY